MSTAEGLSYIVNILWYKSYDAWGKIFFTSFSWQVRRKLLNHYVIETMNLRMGINQTTLTTDFVENSVKLSNVFYLLAPKNFLDHNFRKIYLVVTLSNVTCEIWARQKVLELQHFTNYQFALRLTQAKYICRAISHRIDKNQWLKTIAGIKFCGW